MLLPYPTKYRKRRGRMKRRQAVVPASLMLVTAGAVEEAGGLQVTLTFNTTAADPLNDVSGADASNWTARFGGRRWFGMTISNASFDQLALTMAELAPLAGSGQISYAANPSDISDELGRELGAFEEFPL